MQHTIVPLEGHATRAGTERHRARRSNIAADFFRSKGSLLSVEHRSRNSRRPADGPTDLRYVDAVVEGVGIGVNVLDSAISYRCMRSERAIGKALLRLVSEGWNRSEIIIVTKGGFIPWELTSRTIHVFQCRGSVHPERHLSGRGYRRAKDLFGRGFLRHQLMLSLQNMGISCVDAYLLHNPEVQLFARLQVQLRLAHAFEALEEEVSARRIRMYGIATWTCLRVDPERRDHLDLTDLINIAYKVAARNIT